MGADGMKAAWLEKQREAAICCVRLVPEAAIPSLAKKLKKSGTR
ncbi:hypothetical protein GA0061099_1009214 [Bradyrhizobium yuanmingense]|uniref:Uncharacterized protein n=1 Tax=Bradyrhizobium yuanmingense TaxID=108015 RepID=A0A1C3X5Z1_9BRAD|nr:hypothetical protein IQ15_05416 [Bradyrhizobium yuanmingense]SCB47434.1 hypothetical protein GA0061099_1009214 [Bradyrhizobium yuanmingense]